MARIPASVEPNLRRVIGRISGKLIDKAPPLVLVDAGGVGYEIDVPMSTFCNLPAIGQSVTLLTHLVVRDDAHQLFGFLNADERLAFRQLLRVAGIGPRTALALLSGLSVAELQQAVSRQEIGRLVKVPGIGRKTAERLLLELKGKLAPALPGTSAGGAESSDIEQALIALGYSERDARAALNALPDGIGVAEGIKAALQALAR